MSKRKSEPTLLNFFKRVKPSEEQCSPQNISEMNEPEIATVEVKQYEELHPLDLGSYLNTEKEVEDLELKKKLLTEPWAPNEDFIFPVSTKRKLKFQRNWLKRFPWLVYTKADGQGVLCRYCTIFQGHREYAGKGCHQQLKNLVTKPFNKWKDAIETFYNHAKCQYHGNNVEYAENFLQTLAKGKNVLMQLDITHSNQVEANRKKLKSIVETIILCGRQELPLRGTMDSGPLIVGELEPNVNDGNFRALLRMRLSCGDQNLKDHFDKIALNATYISPDVQNNLIKICGSIIQEKLVERINKAKSFSVLVDGTTDVSKNEQLSLCVRYLVQNEDCMFTMHEDFLEFIHVESGIGKDIATVILQSLKSLGIDCSYLVGQGYDGASSMSGCFKGVQAIIRETNPAALYVHCSAHSLNLALLHSSKVPAIRNCFGTVRTVINFIKGSSKRMEVFKEKVKEHLPKVKWHNLTSMCETRWVENHNGLNRFYESFVPILETLEMFENDPDPALASTAAQLSKSMLSSSFVVSLITASTVFAYTLSLCKNLQHPACDLSSALEHIEDVVEEIKSMRNEMDATFGKIFEMAKRLLISVGENGIQLPRTVSRQNPKPDAEHFYRASVAVPFFEDFIGQMELRFSNHKGTISALHKLIPSKCVSSVFEPSDYDVYEEFLNTYTLSAEISIWKKKWQGQTDRPSSVIEALSNCQKDFFPNIHFLIKVLATLPVTTCTPERTFSSLRRLKTYLRNSTGQDRLTGLTLMTIHRDIHINPEDVINKFAAEKSRRLEFVL